MQPAKAIPVLRTMTFTQLMEELRKRGMPVGQEKLKAMIVSGLLPFAHHISMANDEYVIWKKGFEDWAQEHSMMEVPL